VSAESAAAGTACTEQAWAKINLTLQIVGRRADGYHELEGLVVFAGVGDSLKIEAAGALSLSSSWTSEPMEASGKLASKYFWMSSSWYVWNMARPPARAAASTAWPSCDLTR